MPHSTCHNLPTTANYFADNDRWTDEVIASWLACLLEHNGVLDVGATEINRTLGAK